MKDSVVSTRARLVALSTALLSVPAALAMAGCSSSSATGTSPHDAAVNEAATDDVSVEDSATPTTDASEAGEAGATGVNLRLQVAVQFPLGGGESDAAADAAAPSIVGATVCVNGMPSIPCVTTDSTGVFELTGVPQSGQFVVTIDKTGYRSLALPVQTIGGSIDGVADGIGPVALRPATAPDPAVGTTVDWTKGQVEFFVIGPGALVPSANASVGEPGATVTITPESGSGPVFLTAGNTFDTTATKLLDVSGLAVNLAPGNYTFSATALLDKCGPIAFPSVFGYLGGTAVSFPVLAGYTMVVGEYCTAGAKTDAGAGDAGDGGPTDSGADH